MMNYDEAIGAAASELARETEIVGAPLAIRRHLESPGFWVLYPDTAQALESARSADSQSYRIPPVVVNRVTGDVTRPVAAAHPVKAADLGPREFFIAREPEGRAAHGSLTGLKLTPEDRAALGGLEYFRLRRGGRDDGDALEATVVAVTPWSIDEGLSAAGLAAGGVFSSRVHITTEPEHAFASFMVTQNGFTDNSWTIGSTDIELATQVEGALRGADWIRFWL